MKFFNIYETIKSLRDLNNNYNSITDSPDLSTEYLELGLGLKEDFFKKSVADFDHPFAEDMNRVFNFFGVDSQLFRYIFASNIDTKFSDIIYRTYALYPEWRLRTCVIRNEFVPKDLLVLLSDDYDVDVRGYARDYLNRRTKEND